LDYNFEANNEFYAGNEPWTMKTEKVNAGFTRTTQHTLTIQNQFVFDVMFEDGTKNSERNAKLMTLAKNATVDQPFALTITLKKN
jgi:hypothetical protein